MADPDTRQQEPSRIDEQQVSQPTRAGMGSLGLDRSATYLARPAQPSEQGYDGTDNGDTPESEGYPTTSIDPDPVVAAQAALDAARQAYHDARQRAVSGAPDTTAAIDDAARRYERAVGLLRDAVERHEDGEADHPGGGTHA